MYTKVTIARDIRRPEATFVFNSAHSTYMASTMVGNGHNTPNASSIGKLEYAVVVVEYFSKWIDAKALATITSATIQNFL